MVGACEIDAMRLWKGAVSLHGNSYRIEQAGVQAITGIYRWKQRCQEDCVGPGSCKRLLPLPPSWKTHVQVLPEMPCVNCTSLAMTTDGDFTARRLRRSIVEKQELEREIFIYSQTIPQTPFHNPRSRTKSKDATGKKKKRLSKNASLKCLCLSYQPSCTLESAHFINKIRMASAIIWWSLPQDISGCTCVILIKYCIMVCDNYTATA